MAPHSETTPRSFDPRGPIIDRSRIRAAAVGAGNNSMRAAGRRDWSEADFDVAIATHTRLLKAMGA